MCFFRGGALSVGAIGVLVLSLLVCSETSRAAGEGELSLRSAALLERDLADPGVFLIEFSSQPPAAVFELGGRLVSVRPGESIADLPMRLHSVSEDAVRIELHLASGRLLMAYLRRAERLTPSRVIDDFEQSMMSDYESVEHVERRPYAE